MHVIYNLTSNQLDERLRGLNSLQFCALRGSRVSSSEADVGGKPCKRGAAYPSTSRCPAARSRPADQSHQTGRGEALLCSANRAQGGGSSGGARGRIGGYLYLAAAAERKVAQRFPPPAGRTRGAVVQSLSQRPCRWRSVGGHPFARALRRSERKPAREETQSMAAPAVADRARTQNVDAPRARRDIYCTDRTGFTHVV